MSFVCLLQKHARLAEQIEKLQAGTVTKGLYSELTQVNMTLESELECLRNEAFKLKVRCQRSAACRMWCVLLMSCLSFHGCSGISWRVLVI